jgi:8-oxo-dGTP pyrophosphatase MutT (NUDIX family)
MHKVLTEFLSHHAARAEESIDWGDMPLHLTSYLTAELPPLQYVTSVRAVVTDRNGVLVLHDGSKEHVLPGGRRESGESLEMTLRREVLEETGYTLHNPKLMGFMHFHHLSAEPNSYRCPYPDFVQLVFRAQPGEYLQERIVQDVYVKCSGMVPLKDVVPLHFNASERLYLASALERTASFNPRQSIRVNWVGIMRQ